MATTKEKAPTPAKTLARHRALGLSDEEVLQLYAQMTLIRALDDRLWALNRQGKVPLVASAQGHEGAQMGSAWAAIRDGDYFFFPYYRSVAMKMVAGITPLQSMLSYMGKAGDPFSGGRQFPMQGASLKHRIIQISNVVASGITHAVGYAKGCKLLGENTVILTYFGDGGSSQGECHEAMNFAGIYKLPVIFICENNRLAISVPYEKQVAIANIADRAAGYGFPGYVVDGADLLEAFQYTQEAIARARTQGPTFLEMKVERLRPHTTDDDERRYRPPEELQAARQRDPLPRFRSYLTEAGLLTDAQEQKVQAQVRQEVNEATEASEKAPWPELSTFFNHLYAA